MVESDMPIVPVELYAKVQGFLTQGEAELLHSLVLEVPTGGNVVEIGSYQARSTVAMALAAKSVGCTIWAIDPHITYETSGTQFGMFDNQAYYENIAHFQVGGVVKTLNISSSEAFILWNRDIHLVFIDGDHDYEAVRRDWYLWSMQADVVALHDTAGHHEGVTQLVNEVLASGTWERTQVVDSISVFRSMAK